MKEENNGLDKPKRSPLLWNEGLRAFICMIPMLGAAVLGQTSIIVSLGQAGFFFSSIPLPMQKGRRLLMSSLLIALGLGFYLMGGNVVFNPWLALIFTFFVAFNIGLLSGYPILGLLAIHFISIYTAGLNASSPDKVHANFFAFVLALGWGALISILFKWKGQELVPAKQEKTPAYFLAGIRMGIGTSVALFVSYLFGFSRFGWAPSGAGLVIRYDTKVSKMLAWARFIATIGGAALAIICFFITLNIQFLMIMSLIFTVLNGLFKSTKIGKMPLFYTATILILYSLGDPTSGPVVAMERVIYNVVGIAIGLVIVLYPFPALTKWITQRVTVAEKALAA
jgi:uncharacterized membrane protein YccC